MSTIASALIWLFVAGFAIAEATKRQAGRGLMGAVFALSVATALAAFAGLLLMLICCGLWRVWELLER